MLCQSMICWSRRCSLLLAISAVAVLSGCGGSGDSQANGTGKAPETTSNPDSDGDHRLVGVWLGIGYLDEDAVANKAASLATEAERNEFISMAQSFQSTRLGVLFGGDANYEFDMEIVSTGGQVMRGSTYGTWKVADESDQVVVVESSEITETGTEEAQLAEYTFADPDHFAFVPPVHPMLLDCDPLIVFERQAGIDEKVANENPATNLR